ncbi:signal peptidase I [Halomicrobium katesii]|uniref:signal peptidase I n=1 Tax=Halomicrobium katesii TaxID=437163 RepID=UPI0009B5AA3D|nr:signal peptidase I [Halomicrobium katesii]
MYGVSDRHPSHGRGPARPPESRSPVPGSRVVWRAVALLLAAFVLVSVFGQIAPISYVNSGSMAPALSTGDGFVAVPAAVADDPEPGDVIVYRSQEIEAGGLVTHRIVARTDEGFVTKGDANPVTDQQAGEPPVSRDRIVAQVFAVDGRVVSLSGLGTVSMTIRSAVRASPLGLPPASMELLVLAAGAVLFWRGR